nr:NB-ARC domain-containing protein [Dendronalium sp. ChiSLP03b]MDZ8206571.1 NB-ARC domain-containing protein [Dendronalium sp. ChiSLP03b]
MTNSKPYKILFLRLAPGEGDSLVQQDKEYIKIDNALDNLTDFNLLPDTEGYSLTEMVKTINQHRPNVIHLSGHGSKNRLEVSNYSLTINGEATGKIRLSPESIARIFGSVQEQTKPRILFFNVCLAGGIANDAGEALRSHFDCVIGMQELLDQKLALGIAASFYQNMAQGDTVAQAIASLTPIIEAYNQEYNQQGDQSGFNPEPEAYGNDQIKFDLNIKTSQGANIPRSTVVKFVGREQNLDTLHQQVQQQNQIAITGVDGIGKTELAIQYAVKYRKQAYSGGVCWLRARDISSLAEQMLSFAKVYLKLSDEQKGAVDDFRENLKSVSFKKESIADWFWQQWEQEQTVLVVFDGVTDYKQLRSYLPPLGENFKILVTAQPSSEDIFNEFKLPPLEESAALDLLRQSLKNQVDQELSDAQEICQVLNYLPLALNLVGLYVKKRNISLFEMRRRLKQEKDPSALEEMRLIFELNWEQLSLKAKDLAFLLSVLPSTSSWEFQSYWDFFKQRLDFLRSSLGEGVSSVLVSIKNDRDIEDARVNLQEWNLLAIQDQSSYSLNPLVRLFFVGKFMDSPNGKKIVQVLGLSHSNPNRMVLPADFQRLPTVNEFVGYPGCYIAAYSHQQQGSAYSVGSDIYVMGQVRVSGSYQQTRDGINICVPNGYAIDSDISADKALNQKFSKTLPEACKDDSCWAGGDTAGFLGRRTGSLDEH